MGIPRQYSMSDVRVTLDGEMLTEFADGESIKLSFTDDDTVSTNGANGASAIAFKHNNVIDLGITLLATSPDNAVIASKFKTILDARRGAMDVVIADGRGDTIVAGRAAPKKRSDVTFGTEVGSREWALSLHVSEYTVAGNLPA